MINKILIGDTEVTIYGAGPTLVMCHGFTTNSNFWREQIDFFSKTHQVIVFDLPGHGASPRPAHRQYSINAFVDDLEKIFNTLSIENAILIGLSMGGTIAQFFAIKHPNLLCALVLVSATPHGVGTADQVSKLLSVIESVGIEHANQLVIDHSFGRQARLELIRFAKHEVSKTPAFVAHDAISSMIAADTRHLLSKITLPTLVICGEEDLITPVNQSEYLVTGITDAQLHLIKQAGHFPMLEQPEQFNLALQSFLDQLPAPIKV